MLRRNLYKLCTGVSFLALVSFACSLGGGGTALETAEAGVTPTAPATSVEESKEAAPTDPDTSGEKDQTKAPSETPRGDLGGGTLHLEKTSFKVGEQIQVSFTASDRFLDDAWVGVIPSHIPHGSETENDKVDLDYEYLRGLTSGTLTFRAPDEPGSYDLRMHDTADNGREVASVAFVVTEARLDIPTIHLEKETFKPGERIPMYFTAPLSFPRNAWVGIIPSSVAHGSEAANDQHDIAYQYLGGLTSGTLTFAAPDTPGSYDLRMHDTDGDGQEVASVTFQVE